jgi:hypothetical protein
MSFIGNALGSIFGGITGANQQAEAAQNAAQTQANAQLQAQQYLQQNLSPYQNVGQAVIPQIMQILGKNSQAGFNVQPFSYGQFSFNPSDLQNTPGYQFTLQQGEKNVNNALSNQGLLGSGAQAKALSDYTTGLASNTYNQQLQNALNMYNTNYNTQSGVYNTNYQTALGNYSNNLNPLLSLLNLGQNSAAGVGQGAYNAQVGAGNALAAGQVAAGQTTANAFNSLMGAGKTGASIYAAL